MIIIHLIFGRVRGGVLAAESLGLLAFTGVGAVFGGIGILISCAYIYVT